MDTAPQGKIGRYVIQGELGRGAMGVVYRAQDPAIGRTVAVKTIRIGQFNDEREIKHVQDRMMREAQAAGILSHTNIVTIYDIQHENDTAFIFMEFVDGDTLEKLLLSDTPIDKQFMLRLMKQSAEALDYAHERGIVHRDVKPANIMVRRDGMAKIADFGIARMQSHSLTQTGQILGTPNYMSPEQISGKPVDGRADQYSLAVMLYEVLTGEKPFVADSLPTLLFRVVSEAPQPVARLNPTLSLEIDDVLQRALAKNPEERFPTCTEFIRALEKACQSAPGWKTLVRGGGLSQATLAAQAPAPQAAPKPVVLPAPAPAVAPKPVVVPAPVVVPKPVAVAPVAAAPVPVAPVPVAPAAYTPPAPARTPFAEAPAAASSKPKLNTMPIVAVAVIAALLGAVGIGLKLKRDKERAQQSRLPQTIDESFVPDEQQKANSPSAAAAPKASPTGVDTAKPAGGSGSTPAGTAPATLAEGAGAVSIRTSPEGANVVMDDGKLPPCTTPCLLELPKGRHTATMMLDTYKSEFRIFYVPKDTAISVNLEKMKGSLEVNSTPPGATITIDGAEHPQKTPAMISLVVGKHTVSIALPGKPTYSQSFQMRPDAIVSVDPNWAN
jgi:tRNA A-37 threonylcarbamoyl transferase component Bud32